MAALWMDRVGYQTFCEALREIMLFRTVTDSSPRISKEFGGVSGPLDGAALGTGSIHGLRKLATFDRR